MGLEIKIETKVNPTENTEKIKNAILSIFPDAECEENEDKLKCQAENIENFAMLLKEQRIRDAARSIFLSHLHDNKIIFWISKQVATVGKVSFSVGEVPLGDIKIELRGDSLPALIDQIAPDTHQTPSRS